MAKLFGAMLMAVGILMALLCGLCSLAFLGSAFQSGGGPVLGMLTIVLVVGGAPTALGVVLFVLGLSLFRGPRDGKRPVRPPDVSAFD